MSTFKQGGDAGMAIRGAWTRARVGIGIGIGTAEACGLEACIAARIAVDDNTRFDHDIERVPVECLNDALSESGIISHARNMQLKS